MNEKGKMYPYVEIIERDIDGLFARTKTKNKFVNEDLLRLYTGKQFKSLSKFAHQNELDFRRKPDLVKILDYYEQILASDDASK